VGFRVLLTNHQSPLGTALLKGFEANSLPVVTADALDAEAFTRLCEQLQPTIVVHSAQILTVESLALARSLALYCQQRHATLICVSSHEVFGIAQQSGALTEMDNPDPDTTVGRDFYVVEQSLSVCERKIILRLPWLLDAPGGVLDRLCQTLIYTRECVVSDSWRGSPVLLEDVVRILLTMVQQVMCGAQNWGYFHLHASDHCSEAELADHVARILQKSGYEVSPIFLGPVTQRFIPSNGWIKGQRCTNNFGFQYRSWRQGIKSRVQEWLDAEIAAGRLAPAVLNVGNSAGTALPQE
jgi:dTDP-4-dehydrorhamnose reductase